MLSLPFRLNSYKIYLSLTDCLNKLMGFNALKENKNKVKNK